MKTSLASRLFPIVTLAALAAGCATPPAPVDYSAFIQARPTSLLVLPPLNDAPDIKGTPAVWAHSTRPLAEAGYYVLPVTLVDETFRQNGVTMAADAQDVSTTRLREFFGADAAVYLRVKQYGTSYAVLASETKVVVEARIVDLRSGQLLWQGQGAASSAEQSGGHQGGLIGMLVAAAIKQVIGTATDAAFNFAGTANARLLGAPRPNGILPGPRSPLHGQPPQTAR